MADFLERIQHSSADTMSRGIRVIEFGKLSLKLGQFLHTTIIFLIAHRRLIVDMIFIIVSVDQLP